MGQILINCDLGENESDERTDALLRLVDAANIGCGAHAGSEEKTRKTLERAIERGILVGAHPGIASEGGRGSQLPEPETFLTLLEEQVGNFVAIADALGATVSYVKLHGSLYHAVEMGDAYAGVFLDFLASCNGELGVFALAGGAFAQKAKASGLKVWQEAFADRGYRNDGSLVPRTEPGALLDAETALDRFKNWQSRGWMDTVDGASIQLSAETFCVHSDSPDAEVLLAGLKRLTEA